MTYTFARGAGLFVGLSALITIAGCATAQPSVRPTLPASRPLRIEGEGAPLSRRDRVRNALHDADDEITRAIAEADLPGISVGVVADGELVWTRSRGVADDATHASIDANTIFRIGSVTKTFTGLAAMKLRDDGKIALDEPAARYVPELGRLHYPTRDSAPVTVRELLTHASGLPRIGDPTALMQSTGEGASEADTFAALDTMKFQRAPGLGDLSACSNLGAALTGLVIARVSGESYETFVKDALLEPLGMSRSSFTLQDGANVAGGHVRQNGAWSRTEPVAMRAFTAAGGLYSTVADLARFAAFEIAAWPARDAPELGPVRRSTLRESQLALGFQSPARTQLGAFWMLHHGCDADEVEHNGALVEGYTSDVVMLPSLGVGVVALSNGFDARGPAPIERLVGTVLTKARLGARTPIDSNAATAVRALASLAVAWDEAAARRLFTAELQADTPMDRMRTLLHSTLAGSQCIARPLVAPAPGDVTVRFDCGTAPHDVRIQLVSDGAAGSPARVALLLIRPSEACQ